MSRRTPDFESGAYGFGNYHGLAHIRSHRIGGLQMTKILKTDVENYIAFASVEHSTALQYNKSVTCFSEFLGRSAERGDLREATVNNWLNHVSTRLSPFTVLGRKRGITPVWNWLAKQGKVKGYDENLLRRTKVVYPEVTAWTTNQVRALVLAAADLKGRLECGVHASALMKAYVLVAYETGFRPSDMRILKWSQFRDGTFRIVQHKTRYAHSQMLSPLAASALDAIRNSGSEKVFILSKGGLRRWELLLFEKAKDYGFSRRKGQACGTLRKTHGTEVCRADGLPAAAESLGHVDGIRVARQSYCEADAIRPAKPNQALIDALRNPPSCRDDHRRRNTG